MEIKLPEGTPENISLAYGESVRILAEANTTANSSTEKYSKEVTVRKYIAYTLRIITLVSTILITAGIIPHQLAIVVAIIYAVESTLTNSKRLITVAQATKAFTAIGIKVARTHQVEQNKIFSMEADKVEAIKKITALNIKLTEEAHAVFTVAETAISQSDIETLQALSLDEDKLKTAMQHIKP